MSNEQKKGWGGIDGLAKEPTEEQKRAAFVQGNEMAAQIKELFSSPLGKKVLKIFEKRARGRGYVPSPEACKDGMMMVILQNNLIGEENFYRWILAMIKKGNETK